MAIGRSYGTKVIFRASNFPSLAKIQCTQKAVILDWSDVLKFCFCKIDGSIILYHQTNDIKSRTCDLYYSEPVLGAMAFVSFFSQN